MYSLIYQRHIARAGDRQTKISPVRSDFNVKGHLHIEKVLVLSQVARHLLLGVGDVLLQLAYPYL